MKIAIAQINPTVGDLRGNRGKVEEAAERARQAGAELCVLPELCLTGYPPMDLLEREGFVRDQLRELETLAAAAKLPINPDPSPSSPPISGSPHGPRAENVVKVVICVKVAPARNPKGINQRAMLRWRRWRLRLGLSSSMPSMVLSSGGNNRS